MSTTSAVGSVGKRARVPLVDGPFLKRFVILCGIVPGALLAFDAIRGNLGVNSVNYAIRSTGMIGLVFLTLSLLITPLRQLTKWNVLISARRNLGVYGFGYILMHFLIFFWYDRDADVGSTLHEIIERVYLWFGFGALVLMIPLALTSFDGMVTKLGPKRWKALHRLAYVAVFGGVVHFFLLVKSDTRRPIAFSIAFGALMLYRVVKHEVDIRVELAKIRSKVKPAKPAAPAKKKFWTGELLVARIFSETHDVKTFRFVMPDGSPLPFEHTAGQYLNLMLAINGKRVNRSYTIASSPTRAHHVEISVKRTPNGYGSHHMHDTVKEGDRIKISAPAGKFVFAGHEAERIVMLAGGVGITPMMSIVRALTDRCWSGQMYLFFAVRKRTDIIFETELDYLQKRFPNLHVHVTLSGDPDAAWDGKRGHITREMIESVVPGLAHGPIMMCGPEPMMKAMRKLLVEDMGIPDAEVHEEAFVSPPTPAESSAAADDMAAAAAIAAAVEPGGSGEAASVSFQKTGKTAELGPDQTLLEAAEDCGVAIPFECRSGICGQCKTKLVSGRVTMEVQDALTSGDRAKGLVLACQARAMRDVVVDA